MRISRLKLIIAGSAVVLIGLATWAATRQDQSNTVVFSAIDEQRRVTLTSPFTGTTESLNLDIQTRSTEPNMDAVFQRYSVFNATTLGIPPAVLHELLYEDVSNLLGNEVTPNYALAYIHVDRDTVKCGIVYDCSLSFYLDSPERYFSYHYYLKPNGEPVRILKQEPMPGGNL